ncbi:hypothetical protein D6833_02610, partial [Candidatus Parcubacteria bacterium]
MQGLTPFEEARGRKRCSLQHNIFWIVALVLAAALGFSSRLSAQDCTGSFVDGLVPLSDLGTGTYKGAEGGLYPGGSNQPPESHLAAGLAMAQQIQPLDAAGNPDPNGKIVLISIGMSNAQQEFTPFIPLAMAEPGLNPKLVIVNGAKASQDASKWSIANGQAWQNLESRLAAAGVTKQQVQAVWILNAMPATLGPQTFPERAQWLKDFLKQGILNLKAGYPNVRVVYFSSRIYAGYATTNLNPEPFAYEGGYAMKWLIEDQINGDPDLAFEGANPPAPWLAWGPYLWADGLGSDNTLGGTPGRTDGLEWECGDFQDDGTHPDPRTGAPKVAQILLDFFKTDPTAVPWFLADSPTNVELVSFAAEVHGADVLLRWVTASEVNNLGFEVQRKQGGQADFEVVAFIDANKSGQGQRSYEYRDKGLKPGSYIYRLRQVDVSGQGELSSEIRVEVAAP